MRILFASTIGVGHFSPLVPFAHACLRAGHDVLVAGPAGVGPLAERGGLGFRPVGEPAHDELERFRAGQDGLEPMSAVVRAFTELFIGLYSRSALPGMLEVIDDWRPDVVVRESAEFASMVAAERRGTPHAEVGIGLSMQADKLLPFAAPRIDDLRGDVGLPADGGAAVGRSLMLTLAPASLEDSSAPTSRRVRRFRVPPADDSGTASVAPWGDPSAPLVYVSFGTEVPARTRSYFPELYRRVLDALAGLEARILMTIGNEREPSELDPLPSSVRVERWVPQAAVMREAAAMVGHGGAGSTLSALAAGVPMAVVPVFADQPSNARRVAEIGAGVAFDGPEAMAGLGQAVRDLIEDPAYRDRARRVAAEIEALPPVDDGVRVLSGLAKGHVPSVSA